MIRRLTLLATVLSVSLVLAADKKAVQPKEMPGGGPFSAGILSGGTLYVSGQTGHDLKTGKYPQEFEAEVQLAFDNIGLVLKEAGMTFADVVAVQVYLTDMDLFQRMNKVYLKNIPRPTRTTVGVAKLAGQARAEITVTARK